MPELVFKGKEFVFNHHLSVPFRPLVPEPEKSVGGDGVQGNLIIHGDNLHALKALLPTHAGLVDVVYIDPPYNTGAKDWTYNDDVNSPMMQEWLSEAAITLDDGLRHDKWLCMMWPRLRLLRQLLADEGVIFISINSVEDHRLRAVCEEVFGSGNYIGSFIWKSRQNKDNRNESGLSDDHEYILAYGAGLAGELRSGADYSNPDDDPRGPWASGNMVGLASKEKRPNLHYDLVNTETGTNYGCPRRGWRYEQSTMTGLMQAGRILWPKKEGGRPREKVFLSEMSARTNVSSVITLPIYTKDGSAAFNRVMPDVEFPFPKPPELIEFLLGLFDKKDALVLDSFAGSGSTAHAVLAANSKDEGTRRFILIEGEPYANDITAERVRRVINGYSFEGKAKEELLRTKLTLTRLANAPKLMAQIEQIEAENADRFDKVSKTIKAVERREPGR